MSQVDVIIPTYKPGEKFRHLIEMLEKQTVPINKIIVMNTEESYFEQFFYGTDFMEKHEKPEVHHLSKREFDHGKTRNRGIAYSKAEYFICMTDDAVPKNENMVEELLRGLTEENAAVAYGRQLPAEDSTVVEQYIRQFNYPAENMVKSAEDLEQLGIKTYFCSNVCAAYNRQIFDKLGGFINRTIFNEDMIYAAGAVKAGYRIAYCAKAEVIHSHHYSNGEQFHRNFDLGVSQADHPEIFSGLPTESEGLKLVRETFAYLRRNGHAGAILPFLLNSGFKFMGYQMGKRYKVLPAWLRVRCSMNKRYWSL